MTFVMTYLIDTIEHDVLLQKLAAYGVKKIELEWICSYFFNMKHRINLSHRINFKYLGTVINNKLTLTENFEKTYKILRIKNFANRKQKSITRQLGDNLR